jgi:glycosyltransferase involved in cell wall biosynthesis
LSAVTTTTPVANPKASTKANRPPVRVAHIATSDASLRYLLLNQLEHYREAGYEVIGISRSGDDVAALEAAGIRFIEAPLSRSIGPLGDLVALYRLFRILQKERLTVVHTHTPKAGLLGQYAALFARVPLRVHTIHGLYFPGFMKPEARFLYVLLERVTMRFSRLNFSQNPEDIPVAIAEHICRADRIEQVGNGIDLRRFESSRFTPEHRAKTRAALGLSSEHIVVGMVARLVEEKGWLEMLRAAAILKAKDARVRFVFVGGFEPAKKDAIRAEALREHGIDDVAQFLGHRTDVHDLYAAMDVFALPSHREGFPRAPMEASAMGIPCVVTDVRGCRQTVDDGVTGFVVPVRSPELLAEAIDKLVQSEPLRRTLGAGARKKAVAEFDERTVITRILAAYDRLIDALPPGKSGRTAP